MIKELLKYLITPASLDAKRSGLLYESIALESRGQRLKDEWLPHCQQCFRLTESFLSRVGGRKLTLLGSGPLFDVWPGVFEAPREVVFLVDAVHPRSVRRQVLKSRVQVHLVERDLNRPFRLSDLGEEIDAVISCNILSQLGLPFDDAKMTARLAESHVQQLRSLGVPVLMWGDFERVLTRGEEQIVEASLGGYLPDLPAVKEWMWHLAPRGEVDKDTSIDLKMAAWEFGV